MKNLLLSTVLLLLTTIAHAQLNKGIALKIGATSSTAVGSDLDNDELESVTSLHVGAEYQILLSDQFALGLEALFTGMGWEFVGGDAEVRPGYLVFPIVGKYDIHNSGFNVFAGVQPGLALDKDELEESLETFEFSVPAGIGYEHESGFLVTARAIFGLTNLNSSSDDEVRNRSLRFSAGYRFNK